MTVDVNETRSVRKYSADQGYLIVKNGSSTTSKYIYYHIKKKINEKEQRKQYKKKLKRRLTIFEFFTFLL